MRTLIHMLTVLPLMFFSSLLLAETANKEKVIGSLTHEPVGVGSYLQMFLGLLIVVALIVGMAWFMRRMGKINGSANEHLKIIGGLSLGQRERVILLQAGKTQLLVGVAPGTIRTLHVLDEPIETDMAAAKPVSAGFAEKLQAAMRKRSGQ